MGEDRAARLPGVRYLVLEGPIGVGKTTLAKRLAVDLGAELLLERPEENPFLPRFYEQPRTYALATQLFFLMQRSEQMRRLHQSDLFSAIRVADFMMDKDRLFAELTLDADELALYQQVHRHVMTSMPRPDLVIYLYAPTDVLLSRIEMRGIGYERPIDSGYLERLMEAYARFFQSYRESPLLIVDAAQVDLVNSQQDYARFLHRLASLEAGRSFFDAWR